MEIHKTIEIIEIEEISLEIDNTMTHLASEAVLANDWLSAEEDVAWKSL